MDGILALSGQSDQQILRGVCRLAPYYYFIIYRNSKLES